MLMPRSRFIRAQKTPGDIPKQHARSGQTIGDTATPFHRAPHCRWGIHIRFSDKVLAPVNAAERFASTSEGLGFTNARLRGSPEWFLRASETKLILLID